jgi:hypothetical protein
VLVAVNIELAVPDGAGKVLTPSHDAEARQSIIGDVKGS